MSNNGQTEPRWVFVGGAPRSGTTYVQLLLYASGHFATAQETHLFPAFLSRMEDRWQAFEERAATHRHVGLPSLMTKPEFDDILRQAATSVMNKVAARKPDASWVLEKTPENVLVWPLIRRLFPTSRFLTVVRDPRAVVASTVAARSWAGEWAHREICLITESWVRSVRAGLALEATREGAIRVRYERLRAQTPSVLREILARLGLEAPPGGVREIIAKVSLQALSQGRVEAPWALSDEPVGFFRKGSRSAWRRELSVANIALIEEIAKAEMRVLGYDPIVRLRVGE